jgi:hypothetical protein
LLVRGQHSEAASMQPLHKQDAPPALVSREAAPSLAGLPTCPQNVPELALPRLQAPAGRWETSAMLSRRAAGRAASPQPAAALRGAREQEAAQPW